MALLELPRTRLTLYADELVKYAPNDCAMARYPRERIVGIRMERCREYGFPLLIIAVFASLAAVAYRYVASPGWSWVAVIGCLGACGFALLGIDARRLVIETSDGVVRYSVADPHEDAEGFLVSVNAALHLGSSEREKDEADLAPAHH